MAKYVTRIEADKKSCPVLLSNGNLIDEGTLDNGRYNSRVKLPLSCAETPVSMDSRQLQPASHL